jgi:4-hydroxy-2-oxoheptanedioate aldolase
MYKNTVKKMLSQKQPVLGCIVNGPYPALVELLGLVGFNFIFIDTEHSSLSISDCEEIIRAAELRKLIPFVRVPENNPKTILHFMDIGAMGIIVPDVNSKSDAEAIVRAVKYAPLGDRGLATTRSSDFGFGKNKSALYEEANEQTMVIALIESQAGVDNAEEILSVKGVDACFIGTSDLSMSMGVYGQVDHPKVLEALHKVLSIGIATRKSVGIVVREGESSKKLLKMGFSIIFTNLHSLIRKASKNFISEALQEKD